MSAKIFCDRCDQEDTRKFYNAAISVRRGQFANIAATGCASEPWDRNWHLCGYCAYDLLRWTRRESAGGRA